MPYLLGYLGWWMSFFLCECPLSERISERLYLKLGDVHLGKSLFYYSICIFYLSQTRVRYPIHVVPWVKFMLLSLNNPQRTSSRQNWWTPNLYYTLCLRKSVETLLQWLVPKEKQQRHSEVHFRLEFDSTENHNYHSKKSWIPCCQTKWSTWNVWFIVCLSSLIQNKEYIDFFEPNFYCGVRHHDCY